MRVYRKIFELIQVVIGPDYSFDLESLKEFRFLM